MCSIYGVYCLTEMKSYGEKRWLVGNDGIGLLEGGRIVLSLSTALITPINPSSSASSICPRIAPVSIEACNDGTLLCCPCPISTAAYAAARLISFETLLVLGLTPPLPLSPKLNAIFFSRVSGEFSLLPI